MKKLIQAVAYYRMSDSKQEASIGDQRSAVTAWAAKHGYAIVREYLDEGISGDATHKRRGFLKMIADAERGEFKAIVVWNSDRFGRFDSIEAGRWIYPLRERGIHLASVTQGVIDWTTFAGRMMSAIESEGKHQYLVDLSRNVSRRMNELAALGLWAFGKPPIGYVAVDQRLVLGPSSDVAFVRSLFASYVAGRSLRSIASELTGNGVLSPKRTPWTATGLAGVLKNRLYTGDFVWNQRCESKYKGGTKLNDESAWTIIPNHHEPIVDRETFAKAQHPPRTSTPHANGGMFALSGLLICGKCGYRMIGDACNRVPQYTCYGYRQRGADFCEASYIRQTEMLGIVVDELESKVFNDRTLSRIAASVRRKQDRQEPASDRPVLQSELRDLDSRLAKATKRLVEVDADLLDVVQSQIRDLRKKRDDVSQRLTELATPKRARLRQTEAALKDALDNFRQLKQAVTAADPQTVRQFLRTAVERIEVVTVKEKWTAKRFKHRIQSGTITLNSSNLSAAARCTLQVLRFRCAA